MPKYIFLDIDGVLNHSGTQSLILQKHWRLLQELVASTNAEVVLISDWRLDCIPGNITKQGQSIIKKFTEAKMLFHLVTEKNRYTIRGNDIRMFLSEHSCNAFVILDDTGFDEYYEEDLYPHFVQTNYKIGLTESDIKKAESILQTIDTPHA